MSAEDDGDAKAAGEADIVVDHVYLARLHERRGQQAALESEIAAMEREIAQLYALRAARFGKGFTALGIAGLALVVLVILVALTTLPFEIMLPAALVLATPPVLAARWCWRSRTLHVSMTMLLQEYLPKAQEAEFSRLIFLEGRRNDLLYHLPGGKQPPRAGGSGLVLMLIIFLPLPLLLLAGLIFAVVWR